MTLTVEEQQQARAVRMLQAAAGGAEASGAICEKSTSLHSAYQSPNEARSMPIRDVERLEAVTHGTVGHPHVTAYLARAQGYSLVKRPVLPADRACILELLSAKAKVKGECDQKILQALADDNQIDAKEAADLLPFMRRSFELANQMLAELEVIAGEGS